MHCGMIRPAPRAGWIAGLAALASSIALCGCGDSGGFATSPAKGKVTYQGAAVKGGTLQFRPLSAGDAKGGSGKPASATIQADGTFVLQTYKAGDGAVVGKHEITFTPASEADDDAASNAPPGKPYVAPPSPYAGLGPKDKEVEIKTGNNEINIELVPLAGAKPAR